MISKVIHILIGFSLAFLGIQGYRLSSLLHGSEGAAAGARAGLEGDKSSWPYGIGIAGSSGGRYNRFAFYIIIAIGIIFTLYNIYLLFYG